MKFCPICGKKFKGVDRCPDDGSTLMSKPLDSPPMEGQVLKDTYRIEQRLSAGGMGAVYRGTHITLDRRVAIKVLLPKFQSTPDMMRRFFREAKLLSQLNHPNVVQIIDFGNTAEGMMYMVMELLQGRTLQAYVPEGKGLGVDNLMDIMEPLCSGVAYAHKNGIVHRDLKPENIFLADVDQDAMMLKLLDFGIGKTTGEDGDGLANITRTGVIMGTAGYLAPEQIQGQTNPDARCDVYALGAILYFCLGGRKPFSGLSTNEIIIQQLQNGHPPMEVLDLEKEMSRALAEIAKKAMQVNPAARFSQVTEMREALRRATGRTSGTGGFVRRGSFTGGVAADDLTHTSHFSPQAGAYAEQSSPSNSQHIPELEQATRANSAVMNQSGPLETRTVASGPVPVAAPVFKRNLVLASAALLFLVVAGGWWWVSRKQASASAPVLEATAPGVTAQEIILGMSSALSGPSKELGRDMQIGIETCLKAVNEKGGIAGRMLRLVSLDDGYEPDRALENVQKLVNEHQVFALVGNVGTPTAKACLPYILEQKILLFGPFTGARLLRQDPPDRYVFNYRAGYDQETAAIVRYFLDVKGVDPAHIAVFAQADSFGDDGFAGVAHILRSRGIDPETIVRAGYHRNALDVDEAVRTLAAMGDRLGAVVMVGTYKPCALLVKTLKDQGFSPYFANVSFVGANALAEEFSELGTGYGEGVIVTQVVPHFNSAATGVLQYREALQRFFPGEHPSFVSLEGYIAARILTEALAQVPPNALTTETLIDQLESLHGLDLGIGSVTDFGPSRHQASFKVWATMLNDKAQYELLPLE